MFGRWTNAQLFNEREKCEQKRSFLQIAHIKIIREVQKDCPDDYTRMVLCPQIASEIFQKECKQIEEFRNRIFEIESELKRRGIRVA